jgi:hypothetical protein
VKNNPCIQKITLQVCVNFQNPLRHFQHGGYVVQQPAPDGVMIFHSSRVVHQFVFVFIQKSTGYLLDIIVFDPNYIFQNLTKHFLRGIGRRRHKILYMHIVLRLDAADFLHFHLELTLPLVDKPLQLYQHSIDQLFIFYHIGIPDLAVDLSGTICDCQINISVIRIGRLQDRSLDHIVTLHRIPFCKSDYIFLQTNPSSYLLS